MIGFFALWVDSADNPRAATQGVPAAIASRDLDSGRVLAAEDVALAAVPADTPLPDVALAPADVIGRSTLGELRAGEMITATRLLEDGAVRPGYATMPVAFDEQELASFLSPGMLIDIVWTPDDLSGRPSDVVARDVRVLRVGAADGGASAPGGSVSVLLEVPEADSVRLAAAMSSGSLSVLMR